MGKQSAKLFPPPAAFGGSQAASSVTQSQAPTGGIVSAAPYQQPVPQAQQPVQQQPVSQVQNPLFYGESDDPYKSRKQIPTVFGGSNYWEY